MESKVEGGKLGEEKSWNAQKEIVGKGPELKVSVQI